MVLYLMCKTLYNVLSWLGTGSNCALWGGEGGGWSLIFGGGRGGGGNAKERVSRFQISRGWHLWIMYYNNSANTLIAVVHLTINIFRQLPAFTCYFHCTSNDTLHKEFLLHLLLKMAWVRCILTSLLCSYSLSHPFSFDYLLHM